MPVLIQDDGTILNQSIALLRKVCFDGGFVPKTGDEAYGERWFFDADADWMKADGSMRPFFAGDADEATQDKAVEIMRGHLQKLNDFIGGSRKYFAGDNVTAADFRLLVIDTGMCNNPGLKIAAFGEKLRALWGEFENVKRVCDNVKALPGVQDAADKAIALNAWL